MEILNHITNLIKRNVRPGFSFMSGQDIYTVLAISDSTVSISFLGETECIPIELFYTVILKENIEVVTYWLSSEHNVSELSL
jgi:hypothetical protein